MKCIFKLLLLTTLALVIVSCGSHMPTYYYLIKTEPEVAKAEKAIPLRIDVNPVRSSRPLSEPDGLSPGRVRGRLL